MLHNFYNYILYLLIKRVNKNAVVLINFPTVPCLKCNMEISIDEEPMLNHQRLHIEEEEQEMIKYGMSIGHT